MRDNGKISKIEELFSDAQPVAEDAIVEALKPLVTIQRDTKDIYFREFENLTTEDAILAYGLAKKLLKLKGLIEKEDFSASEIHKKTSIKKGSVDPSFKNLKKQGLLVGKGTSYEIPNYKVNDIIRRLSDKGRKGGGD